MSHHDTKYLASIYGKIRMMHGRFHDYLGMTLDYREKGKLKIVMKAYTKKY